MVWKERERVAGREISRAGDAVASRVRAVHTDASEVEKLAPWHQSGAVGSTRNYTTQTGLASSLSFQSKQEASWREQGELEERRA